MLKKFKDIIMTSSVCLLFLCTVQLQIFVVLKFRDSLILSVKTKFRELNFREWMKIRTRAHCTLYVWVWHLTKFSWLHKFVNNPNSRKSRKFQTSKIWSCTVLIDLIHAYVHTHWSLYMINNYHSFSKNSTYQVWKKQ